MIYTVRNIAEFCNVDFGFIRRIIDANELRPSKIYGNANEKKGYTFYQICIIKSFIEQIMQKEIVIDIENEEVYAVYESRINLL